MRGTVVKVHGPVTLQFPNGFAVRIEPLDGTTRPSKSSSSSGGAGRPPSPATATMRAAMESDATPRTRAAYLAILREAGHTGSEASAGLIVAREAKRIFGKTLGQRTKSTPRSGGRATPPDVAELRERLRQDAEAGALREAGFYVKWMANQPKQPKGLKQLRPVVYRELRNLKAASL